MKRVSSALASLLVLAALLSPAAQAAPGDLDPSFGLGGQAKLLHSNAEIILPAVATQPDGKVVLAGVEGPDRAFVARLNEDGTLDKGFGKEGTAFANVFEGNWLVRAVAIQPDGKILVAGGVNGSEPDFGVVRFTAGGEPDPSFGEAGGLVRIPVVSGSNDIALAMAIGQGGRILLTGRVANVAPEPPGVQVGIVVLKANGEPDTSFNGTGKKTIATTGEERDDEGVAIFEQPDGKIVVGDESGNGRGNGFTLIRMLPGGGLDPSFGAGGIANTPIPGAVGAQNAGRVLDLAPLPDGRIVASGYGYNEVEIGGNKQLDEKFAAVRYLSNGLPDPSFGGAGTGIFTRQLAEFDDRAQDVEVDSSGRTLISGPYVSGDGAAIIRLDSSGLPDPSFGAGGLVLSGGAGSEYHDAAVDSQERLVVASTAFEEMMTTSVEAKRFLGGPPLPPPGPPPPPPHQTGSSTPEQKLLPPIVPAPHARMKAVPRKLEAAKLTEFSGTASDAGGGVAKVQVALVKAGAAKAGRGETCRELKNARGRFKTVKAKHGVCPLLWLNAKGTAKWSFKLKAVLPPGRYLVYARAVDASGLSESVFNRAKGNRYGFKLLAP